MYFLIVLFTKVSWFYPKENMYNRKCDVLGCIRIYGEPKKKLLGTSIITSQDVSSTRSKQFIPIACTNRGIFIQKRKQVFLSFPFMVRILVDFKDNKC